MQVTRPVRSVRRVALRTAMALRSGSQGRPDLMAVQCDSRATCSNPERVAVVVRALLGTRSLIPTSDLRELITYLEELQDELRARDAAPVQVRRTPTRHWFQRGEALLGRQVREVLDQLKVGRSEKEIARAIGRSPHTVHSHVKTIYRHFNVRSRSELLALWVQVA